MLLLSDMVDSLWTNAAPSFDGKKFKSVTQGAADLAQIPLLDAKDEDKPAANEAVTQLHRLREDDARRRRVGRARLRPADRQRGLPGRLRARPRPLAGKAAAGLGPAWCGAEADPRDQPAPRASSRRWRNWATSEKAFKEDAAHLLYDEARVLDGEQPSDAKSFSDRLARLITRGLRAQV